MPKKTAACALSTHGSLKGIVVYILNTGGNDRFVVYARLSPTSGCKLDRSKINTLHTWQLLAFETLKGRTWSAIMLLENTIGLRKT